MDFRSETKWPNAIEENQLRSETLEVLQDNCQDCEINYMHFRWLNLRLWREGAKWDFSHDSVSWIPWF